MLAQEESVKYIVLPNSDLEVSKICFGGEQLGGFDLGIYNVKDTIHAAHESINRGINFFDTADCYNLGKSEENLSKILKSYNREKLVISSKYGVRVDTNKSLHKVFYDNSRKWLEEALPGSLKRLKTDYIDLYQVHYWDKKTPLVEIFDSLERKCEQGLIRYYGVSNMELLEDYSKCFPHLVTFSNEYSLVNRTKESIIKSNIEHGLSFLAYGSLGQGILSGKYSTSTIFDKNDRRGKEKYVNFHGDKLKRNLQIVREMSNIVAKKENVSLSQLAINWILFNLNNTVVITGIKNTGQLNDILQLFKWELTNEEVALLNNIS